MKRDSKAFIFRSELWGRALLRTLPGWKTTPPTHGEVVSVGHALRRWFDEETGVRKMREVRQGEHKKHDKRSGGSKTGNHRSAGHTRKRDGDAK